MCGNAPPRIVTVLVRAYVCLTVVRYSSVYGGCRRGWLHVWSCPFRQFINSLRDNERAASRYREVPFRAEEVDLSSRRGRAHHLKGGWAGGWSEAAAPEGRPPEAGTKVVGASPAEGERFMEDTRSVIQRKGSDLPWSL